MTISLRNTTIAAPEIDYLEIIDSTTTLEASAYTIGPLTGPLTINEHTLGDRASLRIYDVLGITNTHHVTLDFGEVGSTVTYIDQDGISQTEAMPIVINDGKADFELVRSGTNWILNQDSEGPSTTALEALVQANDNRYQQHLIDLHGVNLNVRAVDTLVNRDPLVPWDNTAPGFPITSAFFKITDAPDSTTALTDIRLTPDVPKTLYIIGPGINASTGASVGGQISGYEFIATLSNDVVSYTVGAAGGAIAGGYTDPETDYVGVAYDDLTAFSTSVFDAVLIGASFEFDSVQIETRDSLDGTDPDEALAATQGPVLNAADIDSGAVTGTDLVLTLKGGDTKVIDVTALLADVRLQAGVYNATTQTLDLTLTNAAPISIPVADLLPVTSDSTLKGDGAATPLGVNDKAITAAMLADATPGTFHGFGPTGVAQEFQIADSGILSGAVDVDALMQNLPVGKAFSFHTSAAATLTSALDLGEMLNDQLNATLDPLELPAGVNGFITKNATGGSIVHYTYVEPELEDLGTVLMHQDLTTTAGLFTAAEYLSVNSASEDPRREIKYSNIALLNDDFKDVDGFYRFMLVYQDTTGNSGNDVVVEWKQTSLITETSVSGFELISNTVADTSFNGLSANSTASAAFDGSLGTSWFWSIGTDAVFSGGIPVSNSPTIVAKQATLYVIPLTAYQQAEKAIEKYESSSPTAIYEVESTANNSTTQAAGNSLFVPDTQQVNIDNEHMVFDAATNTFKITAPFNYDLTVSTKDYVTLGTGAATRSYHFRDVTTTTADVLGTSGVFGQGSTNDPAFFVLPAGETVTVDIRSVSSGNNQVLQTGAKVVAEVAASPIQLDAKPLDYLEYQPTALEINEYINNMVPYHAVLSHEAAGGNSKTVRVNGVGATFDNLTNATDNGNGLISFSGGTNGNFNRRASTVETITKVGEDIELVTSATGQFDTQFFTLSPDATVLAESHTEIADVNTEVLRLRLAANGFTLFDGEGTTLASGGIEDATYKFSKSYFGWKVERNGLVIHESAEVCVNYNEGSDVPISGNTGTYRVGVYEPAGREDINNTQFVTGFNLTQAGADQMHLKITASDTATGRQWPSGEVNVKPLLERFNAGDTVDTYVSLFDNDYLILNVNDPATGDLQITDNGRQFAIEKIELWIVGTETQALFELANVTATATTGTFQNIGDANPLVIGDDGAAIYVEYGDASRDKFFFLDGIAKAERKGYSTSDLEFQILAGGQLQARDVATGSTIARVWYEAPKRAILFNTVAGSVPSDSLPLFTSGLKTSFIDVDGRDATVLTDSGATTETVERSYDSTAYPFVEIEFVKDAAATNAFYLRPNGTGGVQSQVRMSLAGGTYDLHSSGTGAVDAKIVSIEENESTIKYLIDFSDSTAVYDTLEIAPAGVDAAFTPSPAQTGSVTVIGVTLYASNPTVLNDESASSYVDVGNVRWQWGVVDQNNSADGGTVVLPAPFANAAYVVNLSLSEGSSGITGPAGDVGVNMWTESLTTTQFDHNRDNDIDFAHIHWMAIGIKP